MDICLRCKKEPSIKEYGKCLSCIKERCIKSAKRCANSDEWRRKSYGVFSIARDLKILDYCYEKAWDNIAHPFRALYAFEHPDKSVYVGLTYDYDVRYRSHMRDHAVLIKKKALGGQIFKTFNIWYPIDIVGKKEDELIEEYRSNGWTILNKARGGSLGIVAGFWTTEGLMEDAKTHNTITEWRKSGSGGYYAAWNRGILPLCTSHMPRTRKGRAYGHAHSVDTVEKIVKKAKKPIICVETGVIYESIKEASEKLKIKRGSIHYVLTEKQSKTKGLTFRFISKKTE
jgi:hypothetical protein